MWVFGYHIIDSIITRSSEGIELTGQQIAWPRHLYKMHIRILEALKVWEDSLTLLDWYQSRQWDSDWHNFNAQATFFAQRLIEIIEQVSPAVQALQVPHLYAYSDIRNMCQNNGIWLIAIMKEFDNWTWNSLPRRRTSRVFADYSADIGELVVEHMRFASTGIIEGIEHFRVDFNNTKEVSAYSDLIRGKLTALHKSLELFQEILSKRCDPNEIL